MRIIGFDIGSRTIGVAVSDPLGIIAQGLETFRYKEGDYAAIVEYVGILMAKYETNTFVFGMPLHMNGDEGEAAERVKNIAKEIQDNYKVKIEYIDERLTTVQVTRTLVDADVSRQKRKKVVDKLAAVVILQTYLDKLGQMKK